MGGRGDVTLGSGVGLGWEQQICKKDVLLCYLLHLLSGFVFTLFPTSFYHDLTNYPKTTEKPALGNTCFRGSNHFSQYNFRPLPHASESLQWMLRNWQGHTVHLVLQPLKARQDSKLAYFRINFI